MRFPPYLRGPHIQYELCPLTVAGKPQRGPKRLMAPALPCSSATNRRRALRLEPGQRTVAKLLCVSGWISAARRRR